MKTGCGARVTPYVDESVIIDINPDNKDMSPEFLRWLRERNLSSDDRIMRLKEGYFIMFSSFVCIWNALERTSSFLSIYLMISAIDYTCFILYL